VLSPVTNVLYLKTSQFFLKFLKRYISISRTISKFRGRAAVSNQTYTVGSSAHSGHLITASQTYPTLTVLSVELAYTELRYSRSETQIRGSDSLQSRQSNRGC